ncbi:crotonase/enoyl-CoA hydratase family protein [Rhodobacter lacus]|uniref:Crotonase/enoyl-CoA hydratase family protein n=1 Tax=Rhodobacter lacus TaxID=1641972 RepID=A0ABW5A3U5_9RHOB
MTETIRLNRDARGVVTLWLARTEKHNALDAQMISEITQVIRHLGQDKTVRVVVLAAEGKSFCAGGDLRWMQANMTARPEERAASARALAEMLAALDTCPKPVIGRVQGNAFGGGVGMISVCDVAIAVPDARFGLTETRLGLTPATISPYVIARMGAAKARRVFMSSRLFGAEEAVALDLIARVVAPEALDGAIEAEIAPYLTCAPGAVADAKALVHMLSKGADSALQEATISALVQRWESDEAGAGIAAFFDRKPPPWAL